MKKEWYEFSCEEWNVCYPYDLPCADGTMIQDISCAKASNKISANGFEYNLSYESKEITLNRVADTWFVRIGLDDRYKVCYVPEPFINIENATDEELYRQKVDNRDVISGIRKFIKKAEAQSSGCDNCKVALDAFIRDMYSVIVHTEEEICKITNEQNQRKSAGKKNNSGSEK